MKTTINKNNIGILTYRKFDEIVLLNSSFDIKELFKIILHDFDFVRFEIFDKNKKLLLTTNQFKEEPDVVIIQPAKVERDEEIKWTNFNAYRTPMYIYGKKIEWKEKVGSLKPRNQPQPLLSLRITISLQSYKNSLIEDG